MCGDWLCPHAPQTTLRVAVTFCHGDQHWHARLQCVTLDTEGNYEAVTIADRDFGPFDDHLDVQRFVLAEWLPRMPLLTLTADVE